MCLERINDNVYQIELYSEYKIPTTCNDVDLTLFNINNEPVSRKKPSQEGRYESVPSDILRRGFDHANTE